MEHNFAVTKQMLFKEKHQFYEKKLKELKDPAKKSAELSAKIRDLEKDISSRKKVHYQHERTQTQTRVDVVQS
jgi:hypothetical protein